MPLRTSHALMPLALLAAAAVAAAPPPRPHRSAPRSTATSPGA